MAPNYSLGLLRQRPGLGRVCLIPYSYGSDTNLSHPNRWRNHRGMALSETDCPEVSTTTINTIQLNDTSHTVSQINKQVIIESS